MKDFGLKRLSRILYYCVDAKKTRRRQYISFRRQRSNKKGQNVGMGLHRYQLYDVGSSNHKKKEPFRTFIAKIWE